MLAHANASAPVFSNHLRGDRSPPSTMGHRPRGIRFRPDRPQGSGKKRPIAGSVQRVAARQPEDTPGDPRQPETARLATISGSVIMTSRIDAHHRGPAHP